MKKYLNKYSRVGQTDLKYKGEACGVEDKERQIVSNDGETAKATHRLKGSNARQHPNTNDQSLNNGIEGQLRSNQSHAMTNVVNHFILQNGIHNLLTKSVNNCSQKIQPLHPTTQENRETSKTKNILITISRKRAGL